MSKIRKLKKLRSLTLDVPLISKYLADPQLDSSVDEPEATFDTLLSDLLRYMVNLNTLTLLPPSLVCPKSGSNELISAPDDCLLPFLIQTLSSLQAMETLTLLGVLPIDLKAEVHPIISDRIKPIHIRFENVLVDSGDMGRKLYKAYGKLRRRTETANRHRVTVMGSVLQNEF